MVLALPHKEVRRQGARTLTVALGRLSARAGGGPSDPAFPQIIKKLIERKQAQIRKVYPGLSCFKEGVRQIPVESVPGIREQGSWWGRGPPARCVFSCS